MKWSVDLNPHPRMKCKECEGNILDHGVVLAFSSLSHDKWGFHRKVCFPKFAERLLKIDFVSFDVITK